MRFDRTLAVPPTNRIGRSLARSFACVEPGSARASGSVAPVLGRLRAACYRCARMEDVSDLELVQWIAVEGPQRSRAEAALCRRYAPRIRLYGLKHLRDPERTQDLVQSVLVAVLQAAREQRIDDPARFDRFVLGTCRNTVSRMRQQAARVPVVADEVIAELAVPPRAIEMNALFACLSKLEWRASQVLMMSFVEERSADEIATKLSTAPGNVRVIRHRALGQLRQCLDAGASEP
jgi:RNA polymerase sigma-70 factor, ECF subfamily